MEFGPDSQEASESVLLSDDMNDPNLFLPPGAALGPLLAGLLSAGGWNQVFYMLMTADFLALLVSHQQDDKYFIVVTVKTSGVRLLIMTKFCRTGGQTVTIFHVQSDAEWLKLSGE